jgi:hypothetical protein
MPSGHLWHKGELPYRVPDVRGRGLPLFIPRHIRSPRQPRSTKQPCRYQSRSAQPQLSTRAQLSRRFASADPTHPRKSSSGPTSTPNRNLRSPASSGTTLTSSHGVHPICLWSPRSWLSTDLKSTIPHNLSSKSSSDLRKIENKL